jgi:hypothetical protein
MRVSLWFACCLIIASVVGFFATSHLVEKRKVPPFTRETAHVFVAGSQSLALLRDGWSWPEAWGTWTSGPVAQLDFPIETRPIGNVVLAIYGRSMSPAGQPGGQLVRVKVNGEELGTLRFNNEDEIIGGKIEVPERMVRVGHPLRVVFEIARPTSPKEVLMSADERKLGLALHRIAARYVPSEYVP